MTKFERYLPILANIAIIFGGGSLLHVLIQWLNRKVLNIPARIDHDILTGFEWFWPVAIILGVIYLALFEIWPDWRKKKKDQEIMKG